MKKHLLLVILLLNINIATAQNFIQDSGFETYTLCPLIFDQVYKLHHWFKPTKASSDYFNACNTNSNDTLGSGAVVSVPKNGFGYQVTTTGNGYAGLLAFSAVTNDYKEYISCALICGEDSAICPLTPGVTYSVSMQVSLAEYASNYACDGLGAFFFTDTLPASYRNGWITTLPFTPKIDYSFYGPITDTLNWVTLTDTFTADSAYKYIAIGSVKPATAVDTVRLKPGFTPLYKDAYYYIDNVKVQPYVAPTGVTEKLLPKLTISPNPVKDKTVFHITGDGATSVDIIVINTLGQPVWRHNTTLDKDIIFERGLLPAGIYYYQMLIKGQVLQNGKLVLE